MIIERQNIDSKAVRQALGQVQSAILALRKTYDKMTVRSPSPENSYLQGRESLIDSFFVQVLRSDANTIEQSMDENANPAARLILEDPSKTLHQKLRAVFSEANRNLLEMQVYSRRDSKFSDYMDRFQNMLMVEQGVSALSENFDHMSGAVFNPLVELSAKYKALLETIEKQKSLLINQLRIKPEEVQLREQEAERFLRQSSAVSYIGPFVPA